VIKFFRTMRFQLLLQQNIKKYLLYAIGEIVLVVIGILIALKINNWNTLKLKHQDEIETYKNIKDQIAQNLEEITSVKAINAYYSSQYERANFIINNGDQSKIDSLAVMAMILSRYSDFHGNGNIYETLVNSGDIKLLENTEIQNKLQKLQSIYSYINKLEDINWEIVIQELSPGLRGVINYSNLKVMKPEKLYSVELQNIFVENIFLTKAKEEAYDRALNEINELIVLIEQEINTSPK